MDSKHKEGISRRRFLQQMSMGLGTVGAGLVLPKKMFGSIIFSPDTSQTSKKVLVLGAGLSGLAAAWELEKAGHEVIVIEARTRPGGRIHTIRSPFADNLHAEAGAVAFSSTYTQANRYIDALGLERVNLKIPSLKPLYYLKGNRFSVGAQDQPAWPYKLTEKEQKLGPMGILKEYIFSKLPTEISDPQSWNQPSIRKLDEMTLGDYMRTHGASQGAIELIRDTQWFGMAIEHGSALSSLIADFGLFMSGRPFVLAGGNDRLPIEMANRLSRLIQYGLRVFSIKQNEQSIEVLAYRGDNIESFLADQVICTLPATVLRDLSFEPELPEDKRHAINNISYLDTTRTYVQVSRSFWFEEGVTGNASTDLPVQHINRHPLSDPGGPDKRAVLESQIQGPSATRLATWPEEDIREHVIKYMKKVHPEIDNYQEGGMVKSWGKDPYALAAYSWPAPGEVTNYLRPLQQSFGRIHFAGEHTSILRGLMEGALRSGVRAAAEVTGTK